ncbi:MAG: helix-turn-helix domain-containing protein [Salipiger thiooxidans]|uniref:helix-turn-helix domain-containing protein n=1 Tax=Salipiger thiooxidans TaxID=282683 RepID=UPI0038510D18
MRLAGISPEGIAGLANPSVFVRAVRPGSLAVASRHLDPAPKVTSRRRAALEDELGARLLHRSTRFPISGHLSEDLHAAPPEGRDTGGVREPALSWREWERGDPREEERGRR